MSQHPDPQRLSEFLIGKLDGDLYEQIENHLNQCECCSKALQELGERSLPDNFVQQLRAADRLAKASEQTQIAPGETDRSTVDKQPGVIPDCIGRYHIEEVLGQGGFGIVYLAHDRQLDRAVAIKVPRPELIASREEARSYLDEARTVARLDHPQIVPVFDVGSTDEHPCYFVSRFVEGTDLAKKLKVERPQFRQSADWIRAIAEALHHAHKQGIIHRDVKPGNILIGNDDTPYVLDFGLALREENVGSGPHCAGTPAYMSPEQARGEGHRVDGRSDIYSLGAIFYELLIGRRTVRDGDTREIMSQIATRSPKPPRQIDDTIPRELERVCLKALAKRASERYTTAKDMAEDLRLFLAEHADSTSREPKTVMKTQALVDSTIPGSDSGSNTFPSSSRRIHVVPKGLRSFDEHDADFFLELLPGPRDRDGLPDSLRFWKTRIETTDADKTFSVGLLYGPSGCGKSSLVKAGLLPRLDEHVLPIFVEATAGETEARLLRSLRKQCPNLSSDGLRESLVNLRLGRAASDGRKILIVLDQFEQWLHAHQEPENTPLVEALRQCDGERVQCIVMVRDDFWMAATRFMRELEIRLVEGDNSAAVDLFPMRHAWRVLEAYGRAFGNLPEDAQATKEQREFFKQAVDGLATDGRVVCVRLALFAEMMKGKPWTPATLKEAGGITGLGVMFLEEGFSATTAPPTHRLHQQAARAALKALLPETGANIKGQMKSYDDLLQASGYSRHPKDFDELIAILDGEVRLITPTDPEGADNVPDVDSGVRYYQLTHDYAVHSIRDWLTLKQQETRRGRAELRLAECAAWWHSKASHSRLPSAWEFATIRLFTERKCWTTAERRLMAKAASFHGIRWGLVLLLLILVGAGIGQFVHSSRQRDLLERTRLAVATLSSAEGVLVPHAIDQLHNLPRDIVLEQLRKRFDLGNSANRLALAYGLADYGDVRHEFLLSQLRDAPRIEADNMYAALRGSASSLAIITTAAQTADTDRDWRYKTRLAAMSLRLNDASLAVDACRLRANPAQRIQFIDECLNWIPMAQMGQRIDEVDDGPLRSAVALAAGDVSLNRVADDFDSWKGRLAEWYKSARDTGTHSAAGWALRRWNVQEPRDELRTQPDGGREWYVNGAGFTMLKIPPGTFRRQDSYQGNVLPGAVEQTVTLTDPFFISDREVSQEQFRRFLADTGYPKSEKPPLVGFSKVNLIFGRTQPHPAYRVSWYAAAQYCNWLSRRENLTPCYRATGKVVNIGEYAHDAYEPVFDADGYRLPTEAEWEYACRARTTTKYWFGDDSSQCHRFAVFANVIFEVPASKMPNGWGLFDMHGSVMEWCQDNFGLYGQKTSVIDPLGPAKGTKVTRGGSALSSPELGTSGNRKNDGATTHSPTLGFRIARNCPADRQPSGE